MRLGDRGVALTVVFETAAVPLTFGDDGVGQRVPGAGEPGSLGQALIDAMSAAVRILAGAAVVWSHPHHRVGRLLVVTSSFNATFFYAAFTEPQERQAGGLARPLSLSQTTVDAHVSHLLSGLDVGDTNTAHRRVLAVLCHLNSGTSP